MYLFIDFYRFPIQLTYFYQFYQLLSIIGFTDFKHVGTFHHKQTFKLFFLKHKDNGFIRWQNNFHWHK